MSGEYKVETLNSKLSSYDYLLGRFKNWIQFKRDIKITSILESKRIQYDLESIVNLHGYFGDRIIDSGIGQSLQDICFSIKSMSFIINNELVEELKVTIETVNNKKGRLLESMINSGFDLRVKQCMDKALSSNSEDLVLYFYIDDSSLYEPVYKAA